MKRERGERGERSEELRERSAEALRENGRALLERGGVDLERKASLADACASSLRQNSERILPEKVSTARARRTEAANREEKGARKGAALLPAPRAVVGAAVLFSTPSADGGSLSLSSEAANRQEVSEKEGPSGRPGGETWRRRTRERSESRRRVSEDAPESPREYVHRESNSKTRKVEVPKPSKTPRQRT
ncbi:UNVERIFIED_CONTAM: hypothetical protein HHA_452500 [Hammondia hammondi]|eukprot:XP_008885633.1 hypothetical protein HHA_452500 [Hammondia hammondi]